MKNFRITASLVCLLALAGHPATTTADEDDLIGLMGALQKYTHKLQLSLDHGNRELAGFYIHEIEETLEEIGEIDEYDGHPVGRLSSSMMIPRIEAIDAALENAADTGVLSAAGREFDRLVDACNACHTATGHGFIVIRRNSANPWLQSFEPQSPRR
jgi:hypothetical protein